jgi:hypothetical protein
MLNFVVDHFIKSKLCSYTCLLSKHRVKSFKLFTNNLSYVKTYNYIILTTSLITESWHTSKKTKNIYFRCYLSLLESKLLILKALPCLVQRFLPPSPSKHLDRVITYNRTFGRCILSPNTEVQASMPLVHPWISHHSTLNSMKQTGRDVKN